MSSKAGWYPDPGGQAGMYRYWDGSAWSPTVTPDPSSAPPAGALGRPTGGYSPGGGLATGGSPLGGQPLGGQPLGDYQLPPESAPRRTGTAGIVIAALVAVALLALIATQLFKPGGPLGGGGGGAAGGNATQSVCPKPKLPASIPAHPKDGRLHGGLVSAPLLPPPWGSPQVEARLPFGVDAVAQSVTVEANYAPQMNWVASVVLAELNAGDGFYAAEEGAEIVAKCVLGAFYGDNPVQREDVQSKAIKVDGRDAWLLEMHLTFDIENLRTKGETAIIVVLDTGQLAAGLYYASIPDSTPELLPQARALIDELRIG